MERWFRSTIMRIYFLELSSNMVVGDVGMLVVLISFRFRLVNKVETVIGPGLRNILRLIDARRDSYCGRFM